MNNGLDNNKNNNELFMVHSSHLYLIPLHFASIQYATMPNTNLNLSNACDSGLRCLKSNKISSNLKIDPYHVSPCVPVIKGFIIKIKKLYVNKRISAYSKSIRINHIV